RGVRRKCDDATNRSARRRLDAVRQRQRLARVLDPDRRCGGDPDARRDKAPPRGIGSHVAYPPVLDRERLPARIIPGNDPARTVFGASVIDAIPCSGCVLEFARIHSSNFAPIITNAIRLGAEGLVQPCQLPSCTTTSPGFITISPLSSTSTRSPDSTMP